MGTSVEAEKLKKLAKKLYAADPSDPNLLAKIAQIETVIVAMVVAEFAAQRPGTTKNRALAGVLKAVNSLRKTNAIAQAAAAKGYTGDIVMELPSGSFKIERDREGRRIN